MQKRCTKGKSCGATCIDRRERCVLELGPLVAPTVTKIRDKLGVMLLHKQVKAQNVRGNIAKFDRIKRQIELEKASGKALRKQADLIEFKKRLEREGLLPKSEQKQLSGNLGDIFMRGIEAGKKEREERGPSVPSDLKRQLAALGAPRQLERSPGAKTRTAPAVRRELAGIVESAKKGSMDLMMDDISRMMRGSLPQNLQIASAGDELGMRARFKTSGGGSATGNTRWARDDAEDFDKSFKIYKRIRGDKDMIDWNETVKNGQKIGEGSFGTVLKVGNIAHKRGEVGGQEAEIIRRVGEAGIGPKLHGAEISTKKRDGYGVDLHNGRIAMSVVPGKELGDVAPDSKIAGKNAADIYWKAMADLHRLGIAHNDAHPHNLMADEQGKGRWVDMGLAQASPKAALAEAFGIFRPLKGGDAVTVPGSARGEGNWQTLQWDGTAARKGEAAKLSGGKTWEDFKQRFPVASRVWDNQAAAVRKLENFGLDVNEINSIIAHGIRSPLSSYNESDGFSRITEKQAQEVLNTLYDGI